MTNTSNLYRKVRALVAKTVTAGCTAHEHVAATNLAFSIVAKHGLDAGRIEWPAPPTRFQWSGETGRSEVVAAKPVAKPKPARKAKASAKPKRVTQREQIVAMLRRPAGVTLAQIMKEFGIQRHTARALISVYGREIGGTTLDRQTGVYIAV